MVSTVTFWLRDQKNAKDYLYGVGIDRVRYVRSDDAGTTWKTITSDEYIYVKHIFS